MLNPVLYTQFSNLWEWQSDSTTKFPPGKFICRNSTECTETEMNGAVNDVKVLVIQEITRKKVRLDSVLPDLAFK